MKTVYKDTVAIIEAYNKNDTQQLKDKKVINKLKEKLNNSKSRKNILFLKNLIGKLEAAYRIEY